MRNMLRSGDYVLDQVYYKHNQLLFSDHKYELKQALNIGKDYVEAQESLFGT